MNNLVKITALMSSVTVINLFFNLLKTKVIAIVTGPIGVGLYSIFISLYTTIVSLASVTSGGSVIKAVAEANSNSDKIKLAVIHKILTLIALFISSVIAILIFVFSNQLSILAFNNENYSIHIKIIGFVMVFIIFSNFWQSWLNGLRLVKEIAKIRLYSTILVSISTIVAIYIFEIKAIIFGIVVIPIATFIITFFYYKKYYKIDKTTEPYIKYKETFKDIFKVGVILVLISFIFQLGVYINRSLISREIGIESLGVFFAAWTISMSYIEVFLSALSVDYYPRLIEKKNDLIELVKIINEQLYFSLLVSIPLIIMIYIYAPYILTLLYSESFTNAAYILRWQMLGDVFKVCVWIFGYVLIVHSHLKTSILIQIIWVTGYTFILFMGLKKFGIDITGIAFFISYFVSFVILYYYIKRKFSFKFYNKNKEQFLIIIVSLSIISLPLKGIEFFIIQNIVLLLICYYSFLKIKEIYVSR